MPGGRRFPAHVEGSPGPSATAGPVHPYLPAVIIQIQRYMTLLVCCGEAMLRTASGRAGCAGGRIAYIVIQLCKGELHLLFLLFSGLQLGQSVLKGSHAVFVPRLHRKDLVTAS